MATKFLNLSTDTTLGGVSPSDELAVSQKAIKTYVDNNSGGGSVAIDNSTITKNLSDEIQAVATLNANSAAGATNPIYDWVGTMAEYEAQSVATIHPDWVCYITDDIGGSATEIGEITEALNGKADVSALNTKTAHVVTEFQAPTSANGYTWYRKYADGWVEQGGRIPGNVGGTYNVSMPVEMADTNYNFIGTGYKDSNDNGFVAACIDTTSMTTAGFRVYTRYAINGATGSPSQGGQWQVSGMAA